MNTYMPVYGERSAPVFEHDQPRTLRQYFAQLNRLFAQCTITTDLEKKDFATSFLNADIAEFWEALPEFISTTTTYLQFRYRVLCNVPLHLVTLPGNRTHGVFRGSFPMSRGPLIRF